MSHIEHNLDKELDNIPDAELQQLQPDIPKSPAEQSPQVVLPEKKQRFRRLRRLVRSKKFWIVFVFFILVGLSAAWFIDISRFWLVNTSGARTTLRITTATPGEGKASPVQYVPITINGRQFKTDDRGNLTVKDQPYGHLVVEVQKPGYETIKHESLLDFDPFLGLVKNEAAREADESARNLQLSLKAVGLPVSFIVKDWLTGLPLADAEFVANDTVFRSNNDGAVSFKAPATDDKKIKISSKLQGKYIDKTFEIPYEQKDVLLTFVPAGKHYFISKRSGVNSVYSSNLDGSDVQELIPGTGQESSKLAFLVSPSGKYGLLASSRDGARDSKRSLLERLYIIDLQSKQMTRIDEAVNMTFYDWSGDTMIYEIEPQGQQANKIRRSLRKVDVSTRAVADIVTDALSFEKVFVGFDKIVFLQNESGNEAEATNPRLKVTSLKNTSIKSIGDKVSRIMQIDHDKLAFFTPTDQRWQEYNFNTNQTKTSVEPTVSDTRVYLSSSNPEGSKYLYVDKFDNAISLFIKSTSDSTEKDVHSAVGLRGPIRWVGNVLVFRIVNGLESADYVVSPEHGAAKKISDVYAILNLDNDFVRY